MSDGKIIILHEEKDLRAAIEADLQEDGYAVYQCETIKALSQHLARHDFDILLLDARPPDGDGIGLVQDVRRSSDVGIILLACEDHEVDTVLGLELGADDYMTKPFRMRELRARVNALRRRNSGFAALRGRSQDAPDTARQELHGLRVHGPSRSVRRIDGQEVRLTTLEFDVLEVLLARPDQVLSRRHIMENIRGGDWAGSERAIDGLVSRLRRKLFTDGSGGSKIKTVRGKGYLMTSGG
jgi:DNA-binding response OmpR family regulator